MKGTIRAASRMKGMSIVGIMAEVQNKVMDKGDSSFLIELQESVMKLESTEYTVGGLVLEENLGVFIQRMEEAKTSGCDNNVRD